MTFLGAIKFVIKRSNDDFRWEVKVWTVTEKKSFQYCHDRLQCTQKKKNPIIKLVIKWSMVGERNSCVENLYDESQLIMGAGP